MPLTLGTKIIPIRTPSWAIEFASWPAPLHAFYLCLIVDDADDSADDSHIYSRMIEFIALFDMIFQIALILADISLCCLFAITHYLKR